MTNRIAPTAVAILIAMSGAACIATKPSAFYQNFSLQQLIDNKAELGLDCHAGAGGGGGIGVTQGGFGFGPRPYHFHKSVGFSCQVTDPKPIDDAALIAALKQQVERSLQDEGGKFVDRGDADATHFYIVYSVGDAQGRLEVSGRRVLAERYDLQSDLDEKGTSR